MSLIPEAGRSLRLASSLLAAALAAPAFAQTTERVSVATGGAQGDRASFHAAISADGRFVVFGSGSTNFVPGGTNRVHVYLRDLQTGTTELVSVNSAGEQANYSAWEGSVSADGRYVAFSSEAINLVTWDTNGAEDIFLRDRHSGTTERVSVATGGTQGNYDSNSPSISPDGRYVAFESDASDLVPGDTNNTLDVFLRDCQLGTTERVSIGVNGAEGNSASRVPSISADGRYVAFYSGARNLVPSDTNGHMDAFIRDRQNGTTERMSVGSGGEQGNGDSWGWGISPSISSDGRFVSFCSAASNLAGGDTDTGWDVYVRDRRNGITERVVELCVLGSISSDGRFVAFASGSPDKDTSDTNGFVDIFVRDRQNGSTERVSLSTSGRQGDDHSGIDPSDTISISADGRRVAFTSDATNLVPGDSNAWEDVFVRDRGDESAFVAFCFGDGTDTPCPCQNTGGIGRGCENSASTGGALLTASGVASLSSDTVRLTSAGEPLDALCVVFQGRTAVASVAFAFGDGLRCVSGDLERLYARGAAGGTLTVPRPADPSLSARSAASGDPIPLGATRNYQVYYRDPSPGFCPDPPGGTFNVSNAIAIAWGA